MIASSLNRSIADVTKRAKIIQTGFGRTVNAAAQGLISKVLLQALHIFTCTEGSYIASIIKSK